MVTVCLLKFLIHCKKKHLFNTHVLYRESTGSYYKMLPRSEFLNQGSIYLGWYKSSLVEHKALDQFI